jgi:hypothetical protein
MRDELMKITTRVQVLDANDDPATGATVNYKILDPLDVVIDSGTMTHKADGIFETIWDPIADDGALVGEFTFEAYSSNPKFRESRTYNVEKMESLEVTNSYNLANDTAQHTVLELTETADHEVRETDILVDTSNINMGGEWLLSVKVDATNYRLLDSTHYFDDYLNNVRAIAFHVPLTAHDIKLTYQSDEAEGGAIDIPYSYSFKNRHAAQNVSP